jgi:AcrR family transcriptional regulator
MAQAPAPVTSGVRPGGRSARVVSAVLEATLEELARVGYGALSVERVAEIAGVAKTTVYRRWPQKPGLVQEALLQRIEAKAIPWPDEGPVLEQMVAYAWGRLQSMHQPEGQCTIRMLYSEGENPEVQELVRALRQAKLKMPLELFQRGVERGEIPPGSNGEAAWQMIIGTLHYRVFLHNERPSRAAVRDLVHGVLFGVIPRAAQEPSQEGLSRRSPRS